MSASHNRAADSTSVCSTDLRSKGERLMTLSTSAVALFCCSDSLSSSVRACTSSNRPISPDLPLLDQSMITIGPHVGGMDDLAVSHRSAHDRPSAGDDRMISQIL